MELLCIQGSAPGRVMATVSHGLHIRQMPMTVARHPAGGWRIELAEGGFGVRCRSVETAILMEAGEIFADTEEAGGIAQAA